MFVAATIAVAATPPAAANHCRAADARPAATSKARLHTAVVCLVNHQRTARGLKPFRRHRALARAAGRHARDMARRRYFAHQRPGGPDLGARLRRAGWRGSTAGEVLAYGCGTAATARTAVRGWMNSPSHRAILLGRFRQAGPAVAKRPPVRCGSGATWVLDVGRR
jgi:uncharacterized protein YkwD